MNRIGRERDFGTLARWITVAVTGALAVVVAVALLQISGRTGELSTESVERAIRSSIVQCYALEGAYPPDLAYLEKNYGLMLDGTRYVFDYQVPGSNVFPIVRVVAK
jgi:hypothetical protein